MAWLPKCFFWVFVHFCIIEKYNSACGKTVNMLKVKNGELIDWIIHI